MTLDSEFTKQTSSLIEQTLELYKSAGVSPRVGQLWNCQNVGDFLCGFFGSVGRKNPGICRLQNRRSQGGDRFRGHLPGEKPCGDPWLPRGGQK